MRGKVPKAEGGKAPQKKMKQPTASFDINQRRVAVRRTAWIMAAVAIAIFVLFFLKVFWH